MYFPLILTKADDSGLLALSVHRIMYIEGHDPEQNGANSTVAYVLKENEKTVEFGVKEIVETILEKIRECKRQED